MSEIPNAKDLVNKKQTEDYNTAHWKQVSELVTQNFKLRSAYLGYGPTNCVEIYNLEGGDKEVANSYMKLFQSMFSDKGYNVMATYKFEVLNVGMSPIVRDKQFTFSVCPCVANNN